MAKSLTPGFFQSMSQNRFVVLAGGRGYLHAVTEKFVHGLVHIVGAARLIAGGALEFGHRAGNQGIAGRAPPP